ncbi:MAG: hypothetical protein ACOY40_04780 [Bacillota bacterium]
MRQMFDKLHQDQGGSVFVETALLIIGIAFAVAPFMFALGAELGGKIEDIKGEIEQVGL